MRRPVDVRDERERAELIKRARAEKKSAAEWYAQYRDARASFFPESAPGEPDAQGATSEEYGRWVMAQWGLIASGPSAAEYGLALLGDPDPEVRQDGVGVLEGIGDPAVVSELTRAAESEEDEELLDAITQALIRFEAVEPRAAAFLAEVAGPGLGVGELPPLFREFWPITSAARFAETDPLSLAESWNGDRRDHYTMTHVEGSLPELLRLMPPITRAMTSKHLFVRIGDSWTAEFGNSQENGATDAIAPRWSEKFDCRAIGTHFAPDTWRKGGREGVPGSTAMCLCDRGVILRSIQCMRDGDRWWWYQKGDPLPFEETSSYAERRIRDRFTITMLDQYLQAWAGLRIFDGRSYRREAVLLEWSGWRGWPEGRWQEESLEEAQSAL